MKMARPKLLKPAILGTIGLRPQGGTLDVYEFFRAGDF
jgi:hypothetical protein